MLAVMKQFLHFHSSAGRRLIAVDQVIEVIPMVWLQREAADDANQYFCGLLNFRGEIVPVFTLSMYEAKFHNDPNLFLIVADTDQGMVAVLALEVDYLVEVPDSAVSQINAIGGKVVNAAKVDDEMIRIVVPREFVV